jgi:hypothetical protein
MAFFSDKALMFNVGISQAKLEKIKEAATKVIPTRYSMHAKSVRSLKIVQLRDSQRARRAPKECPSHFHRLKRA